MLVDKVRVIVQCQECGNDEFYKDNGKTYFCTSCGEPHETDEFNLGEIAIENNLDIDFED